MTHRVAVEIQSDIGGLLDKLAKMGLMPTGSLYSPESFGDYYVDFGSPVGWFRIVRDRSQYQLDGRRELLEPAGLWRSFNSREQFERQVLTWLENRAA